MGVNDGDESQKRIRKGMTEGKCHRNDRQVYNGHNPLHRPVDRRQHAAFAIETEMRKEREVSVE